MIDFVLHFAMIIAKGIYHLSMILHGFSIFHAKWVSSYIQFDLYFLIDRNLPSLFKKVFNYIFKIPKFLELFSEKVPSITITIIKNTKLISGLDGTIESLRFFQISSKSFLHIINQLVASIFIWMYKYKCKFIHIQNYMYLWIYCKISIDWKICITIIISFSNTLPMHAFINM